MKKFSMLLAFAALAMTANAQNVKFYEGNKEIPQNSTYTFDKVEEDGFGQYELHPNITVKAASNTTVTVTANCLTGDEIQLCFDGSCKSGVTATSSVMTLIGGTAYDLQYKVVSSEPFTKEISTKITVNDDITGGVVNSITVTFNPNPGSVSVMAADKALSFSNGAIQYNVSTPTELSLYSLTGRKVLGKKVSGHGAISTSALSTGAYIYRLGDKSGKILVK